MSQKCKEIEKIIDNKKDNKKNRERSQDMIKKRAERLKKSIEKLREREMRFQKIQGSQNRENDKFISQFENLCANFKTDKPEEINHKYI
jgi:DNA-binding transcriptional MerR regulator